eukprot:5592124-Pleurochrysis_carterae.AAC.2
MARGGSVEREGQCAIQSGAETRRRRAQWRSLSCTVLFLPTARRRRQTRLQHEQRARHRRHLRLDCAENQAC